MNDTHGKRINLTLKDSQLDDLKVEGTGSVFSYMDLNMSIYLHEVS